MVCIMTDGRVAMPDWKLAKDLMSRQRNVKHNVPEIRPRGATSDLETYAQILRFLNSNEGRALDRKFQAAMDLVQNQVRGYGATVVELPGMFLHSLVTPARQRAFPRNIANSQPTVGNTLITATPPKEGSPPRLRQSRFIRAWKNAIPGLVGENEANMFKAWRDGGEAHCSSNGIREPIKK